ncbi:MAG TPA: ROK family protein [Candidatus Saccharimonadales bacterium]|nr:ROK family protein [Candidatus Saccharimonadales bacterium]
MIGAVDIGGTKTLVALFSDKGKIKKSIRFETSQNYAEFLTNLADTVDKLSTKDFRKFVVAVPGRLDRENGVALGYGTLKWTEENIASDIEKFVNCPVVIENDAKLAGLYEANNIIKSYKKVLYVTIGTGISCALITNGKIDPDLKDSEGGQILVDYRGQMKQWEDIVSGRAIVERFGKKATDINDKVTWKEIARDLSLGIIDLISVIQPEVIVMGGGVNTNFKKYIDYLKADLKKYETPLVPIPPIKQANRPEEAVIYGCYEMART